MRRTGTTKFRIDPKDYFTYSDGKLFWKKKPAKKIDIGSEAGWPLSGNYWRIGFDHEIYSRHQLVYYIHYGYIPTLIDHIDQDRTNDRIENLRPSNKTLNGHNSDIIKGAVPFRGVSFDKQKNMFLTRARIKYKRYHIGYFNSAEEASEAYNKFKNENLQQIY